MPADGKIIYPRVEAVVKFYNRARGFGFLKRPNKPDIFFSNNDLMKADINMNKVVENDLFEFDLIPVKGKDGGRASNMKLLQKAKNAKVR